MRDLPWSGEFDHAFCWGNSFAYLGDEGDAAFLRAVANALKPGGTFALETHFCAEGLFVHRLEKKWFEFGDLLFLHNTEYDPATSRLTSTYRLMQGDRR